MTASNTYSSFEYTDTAFRSNRELPEVSGGTLHSVLFRKSWTMGPPLPLEEKLSYLYPSRFLELWGPKEVVKDQVSIRKFRKEHVSGGESFKPVGWLTGQSLRYATLPRVSWAFLWMQHGGRWSFLLIFPVFCLVTLFGYFALSDELTPVAYFLEGVYPVLVYMFLPILLCWGIGALIEKKFPGVIYKKPKGPLWELNRQTGQVTIFHDPEKSDQPGEIDAQAPFHEWNGYMLSLPDHQGNIWYRLVLVHKTREWALPLNQLVPATTNREEVFAYWDLIRQYMDVTKPLPDIPLFEAYRHLDPTTAEYDKKKGRDPQYWRNMDDETYKAFQRDNMTRLHKHKWS